MALSSNTSGSQNAAAGVGALQSNRDSDFNTALGYRACFTNNTSGTAIRFNTAVGAYALRDNDTGELNTAVGDSALQSNISGSSNTAIGSNALFLNASASNNTALGARALQNTSTGGNNVAIGCEAGQNATGNGNVFIGYQAGQNEAGSNKLYIDNSNIAPNVGPPATGPLIYGDFSTGIVQINGRLGIGTAPSATGHRLTLPNTGDLGGRGIANQWTIYSSLRWKENITSIPDVLEKVQKLRGVTYTRKDNKKKEVGMIAEEVGKIFPEIVDYEKNGTDAIGMSYDRLVAVLVEAVKALEIENQTLEKRVTVLKESMSK